MSRFSVILVISITFLVTSASRIPISGQLKDFEVFKKVLIEKEGRLNLHTSLDSITFYLDRLEKQLAYDCTPLEEFKHFSAALAKIQCGHTQIHPTKAVLKEWLSARKSLPFDYIVQGKKLYTNKLLAQDTPLIYLGKSKFEQKKKLKAFTEIISIDHKSMPQMMSEIAPFLSSDENGIDFKYFQVAQLFEFYRHMSSPFKEDSILVEYVSGPDTLEKYFQTGTAPVNSMNLRLKQMSDQYAMYEKNMGAFKIVRSKIGYFRFHSFKSSYGKDYELFLEKSFKRIKSKSIKKLIIDVRGNTGGAMQYSIMRYFVGDDVVLGRYVVEKPKRLFEDSHIKKLNSDFFEHRRMSRIQKRKNRQQLFKNGEIKTSHVSEDLIYDGEIIVITDEGSFSSASILASHLKTLANAKIVGRRAGGSFYRGNAGTLSVQLPSSKLKMFVNPNTFYSHLWMPSNTLIIKGPDLELSPGFIKSSKMDDYYLKGALEAFE
jgi:hypothetical protein